MHPSVLADRRRGKRPGRRDGAGGGAEIERGNRHGVAGSFGEARGTVEVCRGSRSSCGDLHQRIDGETEVWRETGLTELRRGWVHDGSGHAAEAECGAVGGGCCERAAPTCHDEARNGDSNGLSWLNRAHVCRAAKAVRGNGKAFVHDKKWLWCNDPNDHKIPGTD